MFDPSMQSTHRAMERLAADAYRDTPLDVLEAAKRRSERLRDQYQEAGDAYSARQIEKAIADMGREIERRGAQELG